MIRLESGKWKVGKWKVESGKWKVEGMGMVRASSERSEEPQGRRWNRPRGFTERNDVIEIRGFKQ